MSEKGTARNLSRIVTVAGMAAVMASLAMGGSIWALVFFVGGFATVGMGLFGFDGDRAEVIAQDRMGKR